MRQLFMTMVLLWTTYNTSIAQSRFNLDKLHTSVQFRVKQAGKALINGHFNTFDGLLQYDPEDLNKAHLNFSIQVKSVDTGKETWDKLLKHPRFFNAPHYPEIIFKSTDFKKEGRKVVVKGELSIQNITKEVFFEVKDTGVRRVRQDGYRKGFVATGKIKRSDFKINYGIKEGMLDDIVEIFVFAEYVQGK